MDRCLIIFDIGGVFRDSSKALNEGYKIGFKRLSIKYKFNYIDTWHLRGFGKYNNSLNCIKALLALTFNPKIKLKTLLNDKNGEKKIDALISKYTQKSFIEKAEHIEKIYKKYFNSVKAKKLIKIFPNSKSIIKKLKTKHDLAIFTNSSSKTIKRDISLLGLNNFSLILSEEDVVKKKPSGEGILKIISTLQIPKNKVYYVGDTVSDILAANDAGCKSIVLLSGMGTKVQLSRAKPNYMFKNLSEMTNYFMKL